MGTSVIKAAAATVIGRSHVRDGSRCQDAVAVLSRRGAACIAVADGAGSKKRSGVGAQVASEKVVAVVLNDFERIYRLISTDATRARRMVLLPVLQSLRRKNRRRKDALESMACTLLFAAYKDGRYIAGHIGDGVIAGTNSTGSFVLSTPENGEFLNTTIFVTDRNALASLRLYAGTVDDGCGAMLMTDGTAESLYDRSKRALAPAVDRFFDWSRRLPEKKMEAVLLANLREVFSNRSTDDCSIAIVTVS